MRIIHGTDDITDYVTSIKWGGSESQISRKLEISIINAPYDPNIKQLSISLADKIYLFNDSMSTEYFRGFVVNRERSSKTGVITFTAYDAAFYTIKSSATYNFKDKTAETIAKVVLEDVKVPIGSLAYTGHKQKLVVKNMAIYDIIQKAYLAAGQVNGKDYLIRCSKGKLSVIEKGAKICDVKLTEDTNITESIYKESLENMVNKVKIYDGDGNQIGVVQHNGNIKKYGVFQQTYTKEDGKDPTTTAKSMFVGVDKTSTINALGFMDAITGNSVVIKDAATGLSGLFLITSDTHTWQKGSHTMTLSLKYISVKNSGGGSSSSKTQKYRVNTRSDNLNFRKSPNGTIITSIKKGTVLESDGQTSGSWIHVKYNGTWGYCYSSYLQKV